MRTSSRNLDRFETTFDHDGIVANAGLIVVATLMARLGLETLIDRWVKTGSANPGRKILTVVAAMLAGGTHIDHVNMLRAGATGRVLGVQGDGTLPTVGTFLRSFTFGHIRQLDAVASRVMVRAWQLGAGPGTDPVVIDLDSTICEVHGKAKQGAAYGYTKRLGYHPLLATLAGTGEILFARMRKGSAGSSRGVVRFVDELVARLKRAGATGAKTVRADSGFWSWKLIDRLSHHNIAWSITVTKPCLYTQSHPPDPRTTPGGVSTTPSGVTPKSPKPPMSPAATTPNDPNDQSGSSCDGLGSPKVPNTKLWPDWRHHAFITNRTDLNCAAADRFHREHATVELAIRDLKEGTGLNHIPSGHYAANCAWLACAVLAHNLGTWTANLADQPPVTNRTRRTQLTALAAVTVNRSGQPTLRFPARWPWAHQFHQTLSALRALPGPSG